MTLAVRSASKTRLAVVGLFGLVVVSLTTATVAVVAGHVGFAATVDSFALTNGAIGLSFGVCGLLLAWHRPGNRIGWLLLAAGAAQSLSPPRAV